VTPATPAAGRRLTRRDLVARGALALVATSPVARSLLRAGNAFAAPAPRRWAVGAYVNPTETRLTFVDAAQAKTRLESLVGSRLDIASSYVAWEEPFPNEGHVRDRTAGRTPLIAWDGRRDLTAIVSGRWDSLLRERARSCRDFGAPIHIRWAAEFNGEWNPCYGRTREFADAWRHLVGVFESEGASNVRWVWCPFATQPPHRPAEAAWQAYYPGDRYVDWIGMDGYNWGTARSWSRWQRFGEIFGALYRDYAGRKPLMICEVSSAEVGGDKASWIDDMRAELSGRFSRIQAVVWFDSNKETDWRIESSPRALRAFRAAVADPAAGV
jgi:hypothetical protein